jgi:Xaa-Pro aminopeptidase
MDDQWVEMEKRCDFFSQGFRHEYSPRHIFGQDGVDFQERINFQRMRDYKLERLRWAMKKHNLAVLLLNIGDNVRYATGAWDLDWKGNNNTRYALVFHDKAPILFETVGMDTHAVQLHCPWLKDQIYPAITYRYAAKGYGPVARRYWDQIKSVCKENGVDVTKENLGIDGIEISTFTIGQELDIKIIPAGQAINEARYVKNVDELEMMKISCAIGDIAYWKLKYEIIKPGIREREARGKLIEALCQLGCHFTLGHIIASGGNTNPYLRATTDKLIRQGDMVVIDCAINYYYGYVHDLCRSWVVAEKMTQRQKEVYKRCYGLLQNALKEVKAGATTADIASAFEEYYDDKYKACSLVHFAHTIGQGLYEGFWVSRGFSLDYPEVLEENMVLAVEVYAADPGGDFGVRLEDNLVVTKDGYVIYSLFPFEEEAVG